MPNKIINDEIAMILYQDGLNDTEIATVFNCYIGSIAHWRKKHKLSHNYNRSDYKRVFKTQTCLRCKKPFKPKSGNQQYCNNPCLSPKTWENRRRFYLIRNIRHDFSKLVKSNPLKAKQLKDKMIQEEGKDFMDFALNGVFENEVLSEEAVINRTRFDKWEKSLE